MLRHTKPRGTEYHPVPAGTRENCGRAVAALVPAVRADLLKVNRKPKTVRRNHRRFSWRYAGKKTDRPPIGTAMRYTA